jgi:A/G-specific adenine glycosylase
MQRLARKWIRWFDQHARDLPWRRTRDPYAVWISEIMLQDMG